MSSLDNIFGGASQQNTNAPASGLSNIFGNGSTATPTATPSLNNIFAQTPATSTPSPTPSPAPYWMGAVDGTTFAPSTTTDTMGKPLLDFRGPTDNATTTDKTRVDTTFNPTIATTTPATLIQNQRDPSIRGNVQGSELDHGIPLELAGSNEKENLAYQPGIDNGQAHTSDLMENQLASDVQSGKTSLFDAQKQIAKEKGLPLPVTGTETPNPNIPLNEIPTEISADTGTGRPAPRMNFWQNLATSLFPKTSAMFGLNPSEFQPSQPKPGTAQAVGSSGTYETQQIINTNPEKVSPLYYLARGLSFGHSNDPLGDVQNLLNGYKGNITTADLPPATTPLQKVAEGVGNVITMSVAQPLINEAALTVFGKIPGASNFLQGLNDTAAGSGTATNLGWNWTKAVLGSAGSGGLFGLIQNNKQSVAQNVIDTGGSFAAFTALAYPVMMFFKPIISAVGSNVEVTPNSGSQLVGLTDPEVTSPTIQKTLYFKNPTNENQFLRVTATGAYPVENPSATDLVKAGTTIKDVPTLTKLDIQAFEQQPSLYNQLTSWIKGDTQAGDIKFSSEDTAKASQPMPPIDTSSITLGDNGFTNETPQSNIVNVDGQSVNLVSPKIPPVGTVQAPISPVAGIKLNSPNIPSNPQNTSGNAIITPNEKTTFLGPQKSIPIAEAEKNIRKLFSTKEVNVVFPETLVHPQTGESLKGLYTKQSIDELGNIVKPMIQVVQSGGRVDPNDSYHESFHAFADLYLSEGEYNSLMKAVNKSMLAAPARFAIKNIDGYTKEEVAEEYAANRFGEYASNERSFVGPEKSFFKKLLAKIKDFIARRTKLKDVFDRMLNQETPVSTHEGIDESILAKRSAEPEIPQENKPIQANEESGIAEQAKVTVPEAKEITEPLHLNAGFNPNIDKLIEQDIRPAAKTLGQGIAKTYDQLLKAINPTARGPQAEQAGAILREELARTARKMEIYATAMGDARKTFARYSPEEALAVIDGIETGYPVAGTENISRVFKEALEADWSKIQDFNGTDAYIENYFPHNWEDPDKASQTLARFFGKRPLEGTKSFLKKRKIPTTKEGIALGLKPISYNPVDNVMAKLADMNKYIMAHKVWDYYKQAGLLKFVKFGDKPPEGWKTIDDKMSKVFAPHEVTTKTGKAITLITQTGNYYMPEQVADLLNNYLSTGLTKYPIYNAMRKLGNLQNQVQLGLSAYHAFFTSVDAVTSKASLELQKVFEKGLTPTERLQALSRFAVSPVTSPYILWKNLTRGNALLKDYYSANPQIPELVDALERAGGRVRMDSFYKNDAIGGFLKAIRSGNYVGSFFRIPGALIEGLAKPLMQEFVPRQKLGVFADMAQDILKQAERGQWSEYKTTLRLQEAWDAVDYRMGQLVYDNLFWNKALKDAGMLSVRSLGWNIGDIGIAAGGAKDFGKLPYDLLKGKARMTPNMAYIIALPYIMGILGAITYYLYNHKAPKNLFDLYAIPTGKTKPDGTSERIWLPSYMKDFFAYQAQPLQTLQNKLHPEIATLLDMWNNKDYFGTEIRNPADPLVKQLGELFAYQAKQFVPFTITNLIQREKADGTTWGTILQSFAGVSPVPAYLTRTPMQTKIYNLYDLRFGGGTKSQEAADVSNLKSQAKNAYYLGDTTKANQLLTQLVKSGAVKDVSTFVKDADTPTDVKLFGQLSSSDQLSLIKDMQLYELNRYAWYAKNDVKSQFNSINDTTKAWLQLYKSGDVHEPVWKKQQQVNTNK